MAYTPKEWGCGEVVTADALNHIEEGIAEAHECCDGGGGESNVLYVTNTYDGSYASGLDASYADIRQAAIDGKMVFLKLLYGEVFDVYILQSITNNGIRFISMPTSMSYATGSNNQGTITSIQLDALEISEDGYIHIAEHNLYAGS